MHLYLLGRARNEVETTLRQKFDLDKDLKFFFSGFSDFDISRGQQFNKASLESNSEGEEINAQLKFITQSYFKEMDEIGVGWRNIIGLQFKGALPSIIQELPMLENWNTKTQPVIIFDHE